MAGFAGCDSPVWIKFTNSKKGEENYIFLWAVSYD